MKIEKMKNGVYRVRKMLNNSTYTLTYDHKPTAQEIKNDLQTNLTNPPNIKTITLQQALEKYIASRANVLSPSTYATYNKHLKQLERTQIITANINNITNQDLQEFINLYTPNHSNKTIKNIINLILASLTMHDITLQRHHLTYKQAPPKTPYIPTDQDIAKISHKLKNTKYYNFFLLAINGLRVSEIQAITNQDIIKNNNGTYTLNINKARVYNIKNQLELKTTKTEKSTRQLIINQDIAQELLKTDTPTQCNYKEFYEKLTSVLTELKIKHFSPHKLRHYYASKLHSLNIPSAYIQKMGGWATDNILKTIYTHTLQEQEQAINNIVCDTLTSIIT